MARLHINLAEGILEVEGKEEFVKKVYNDHKDKLDNLKSIPKTSPTTTKGFSDSKKDMVSKPPKNISRSKRKKSNGTPSLNKDLHLEKGDRESSLKDYYDKMNPTTNLEKNLIFVSYLEDVADMENIGLNQIYTCYRSVDTKIPTAFKQSIADTSSKKYGWLDTASFEDIKLSTLGRNELKKFPRAIDK